MRKLLCLLLCICLLLTACGRQKINDLPEVLLTIDGETRLTRADLLFAAAYEDEPDTEFLFLKLSEQAICTFLAELDGVNEDPDAIRAEYEIYLESLSATGQAAAHEALRGSLPELSDSEFDALFQKYLYRSASTDAMLKTIAGSYGNVRDPETIRENIVRCLCDLASFYNITVSYPELEDHFFRFEYVS